MKKISLSYAYSFLLLVLFSLLQVVLWAQETPTNEGGTSKTTTITTETTTTSQWYTQPWVWVVGGAVFLIILVALLRGNSSDKEVTHTTVVDRE